VPGEERLPLNGKHPAREVTTKKHYLQVTDADFERASGGQSGAVGAQVVHNACSQRTPAMFQK
jgi:hypothetical protein